MTDDRQTFAIGETIRQKHLDAVARDAARIATQQEAIDELVAGLKPFAVVNSGEKLTNITVRSSDIAQARALLSKHGERT